MTQHGTNTTKNGRGDNGDALTALRSVRPELAPWSTSADGQETLRQVLSTPRVPDGKLSYAFSARRLVAGVAAGGVLAAGVFAAQTIADPSIGGTPSASAAELLHRAALATKDPVVGPGQYLKIRGEGTGQSYVNVSDNEEVLYLNGGTEEWWVPADTSGVWVKREGPEKPLHWFRPGDEAKLRKAGMLNPEPGSLEFAAGGSFGGSKRGANWENPDEAFLAAQPRDPKQLLTQVYRDTADREGDRDQEAFDAISNRLTTILPADLRAALFEAAGMIPGVAVVNQTATLDGRTGVSVGRTDPTYGIRSELIFDSETGQVIGFTETATKARPELGVEVGDPMGSTAVEWTVVDSAPTSKK